jgi:hypothetical protein
MGAKTRSQSHMIFNPLAPGNRVHRQFKFRALRLTFAICLLHEIRTRRSIRTLPCFFQLQISHEHEPTFIDVYVCLQAQTAALAPSTVACRSAHCLATTFATNTHAASPPRRGPTASKLDRASKPACRRGGASGRSVTEDKVLSEIEPYKPRVLKTSLSNEAEARLRAALSKAA